MRERFPFVTESGIVVVPKGTLVPAKGPCVLANDVAELLDNDPELAEKLEPGTFVVSMQSRHSYDRPARASRSSQAAITHQRIASALHRDVPYAHRPRRERGRAVRAVRWPRGRAGRIAAGARRIPTASTSPSSCRSIAASKRSSRRRASRSMPARRSRVSVGPHTFRRAALRTPRSPRHATASSTARRSTIARAPCTARRHRRLRRQPPAVRRARQGRGRARRGARRWADRRAARARLAGRARRRSTRARAGAARDRHDDPQPRLPRHLPASTR